MKFEDTVERMHEAVTAFAGGDPSPAKALYSRRDDVLLANPFGPAVSGWKAVSEALDRAASAFRDGEVRSFEPLATYVAADLASTYEVERWRAKVAGRAEMTDFDLRVSSTYRREEGDWKLVLRHADPISTPDPDGPLRAAAR